MNNLSSALWTEILKMRCSKVPLVTAIGFSVVPLVGGLFMIILKDPEAAKSMGLMKSMGLISAKAQLTVGTAEWAALFNLLAQATAVGGAILFSVFTIWMFGREFSDHTVKELLALPTSRESIVTAKLILVALWGFALTMLCYGLGLVVGKLVDIPGWTPALFRSATVDVLGVGALTILLLPFVAFIASTGRGYMSAFGWTILTVALAQIAIVMGWGDWFPWSVPALFSGAVGPRTEQLGTHSYIVMILASIFSLAATYRWWRDADQTK